MDKIMCVWWRGVVLSTHLQICSCEFLALPPPPPSLDYLLLCPFVCVIYNLEIAKSTQISKEFTLMLSESPFILSPFGLPAQISAKPPISLLPFQYTFWRPLLYSLLAYLSRLTSRQPGHHQSVLPSIFSISTSLGFFFLLQFDGPPVLEVSLSRVGLPAHLL